MSDLARLLAHLACGLLALAGLILALYGLQGGSLPALLVGGFTCLVGLAGYAWLGD